MLARRGARVIDADGISRRLTRSGGAAFASVVNEFGEDIVSDNGEIDRARLARTVFTNPAARQKLEAIVHPLVTAEILRELVGIEPSEIVVIDHPLLVETNAREVFSLDGVLVVDAPEDIAIDRIVESRDMDREAVLARVRAQSSREVRRNAADFIILNIGTLEELDEMAERAYEWIASLGRP